MNRDAMLSNLARLTAAAIAAQPEPVRSRLAAAVEDGAEMLVRREPDGELMAGQAGPLYLCDELFLTRRERSA